jgi:hypothetical protein
LRREGGEEGREEGSHGIKEERGRSVAVIANFLKRKRKTPITMHMMDQFPIFCSKKTSFQSFAQKK